MIGKQLVCDKMSGTTVGFMMGTPDGHSCRRLERQQYSDIYESD